eukprot:CAMPEP_0178861040 /NCGR_PEP_ID=MMETSP0747-20121128/2063_1 /TAXON_ID=913974 /ORGANISM="Nitzschia punctata, Strain CCMP561" /LENGTH=283 /DNA_ID=CAMNT_0020527531 /DNA_START=1 /DNA_END=852 /DNA_ORIENTATION=+
MLSSAAVRGDRPWRNSSDGESVTLSCSQCCSPLGFASLASPETWRFWKHRLSTTVNMQSTQSASLPYYSKTSWKTKSVGSCSSFLAREMVRYAESKAIFTFVVRRENYNTSNSENRVRCLLLRLLSWETTMAFSGQDRGKKVRQRRTDLSSGSSGGESHRLDFQRVAKLVFEETLERIAGTAASDDNNPISQWIWGGVDLCCPTPTNAPNLFSVSHQSSTNRIQSQTTVSTVRLELPYDEYDEVLADLKANRCMFSKEQEEATIALKMGGQNSNGMGLTIIPL